MLLSRVFWWVAVVMIGSLFAPLGASAQSRSELEQVRRELSAKFAAAEAELERLVGELPQVTAEDVGLERQEQYVDRVLALRGDLEILAADLEFLDFRLGDESTPAAPSTTQGRVLTLVEARGPTASGERPLERAGHVSQRTTETGLTETRIRSFSAPERIVLGEGFRLAASVVRVSACLNPSRRPFPTIGTNASIYLRDSHQLTAGETATCDVGRVQAELEVNLEPDQGASGSAISYAVTKNGELQSRRFSVGASATRLQFLVNGFVLVYEETDAEPLRLAAFDHPQLRATGEPSGRPEPPTDVAADSRSDVGPDDRRGEGLDGSVTAGVDTSLSASDARGVESDEEALRAGPQADPGVRRTTVVPDVVGQSAQAARAALEGAGYAVDVHIVAPATTAADAFTVREQSPSAGSLSAQSATVRLDIAGAFAGASEVTVPIVIGESAAVARQRLEAAGLVVETTIGALAQQADLAHTVYRLAPQEGSRVAAGSTVQLTIRGEHRPKVPFLVGRDRQTASERLSALGLQPQLRQAETAPSRKQENRVARLVPPAGTALSPGDTVQVEVYGPFVDDRCGDLVANAENARARQDLQAARDAFERARIYDCPGAAEGIASVDAERTRCNELVTRSNRLAANGDSRGALAALEDARSTQCGNAGIASSIGSLQERIAREEAQSRCNDLVRRGTDQIEAGDDKSALETFRRAWAAACTNPRLEETITGLRDRIARQEALEECNDWMERGRDQVEADDLAGALDTMRQARAAGCTNPGVEASIAGLQDRIAQQETRARCDTLVERARGQRSAGNLDGALATLRSARDAGCTNPDLERPIGDLRNALRPPEPAPPTPVVTPRAPGGSGGAGFGSYNPNTPRQFGCEVGIAHLPLVDDQDNGVVGDHQFDGRPTKGYSCEFDHRGKSRKVIIYFVTRTTEGAQEYIDIYCDHPISAKYGGNRAINIYMNAWKWSALTERQMVEVLGAADVEKILTYHASQAMPYAVPCPGKPTSAAPAPSGPALNGAARTSSPALPKEAYYAFEIRGEGFMKKYANTVYRYTGRHVFVVRVGKEDDPLQMIEEWRRKEIEDSRKACGGQPSLGPSPHTPPIWSDGPHFRILGTGSSQSELAARFGCAENYQHRICLQWEIDSTYRYSDLPPACQ